MKIRNLNFIMGLIVAAVIATPLVVPTIAGISTWKYLAGAIGLAVFVRAGMSRPPTDH
jgi:uncharacterized membrane protein YeiH